MMNELNTLLYDKLARWWPLVSAPDEYADEATWYREQILAAARRPIETLLELGSGGGNNASHLKAHCAMTLVDVSPEMLDVSRKLNPECEHIEGDMRSIRLDRQFDAVFIHDAIMYMTSESDLEQAITTASTHCKQGGVVLIAPDFVRETFLPGTSLGGHDGDDGRALRYLEWIHDPDPNDTTYTVDYALLLREADGSIRHVNDRHTCGLFTRNTWLEVMKNVGLQSQVLTDSWNRDSFIAINTC